jgi:gamma-glutamyltranspeptidase / glutathione hydrolase
VTNTGTQVAVSACNELAAAAGIRLAELGGNAIDAALAAVLVSQVSEPGLCALAGGAFLTVAPVGGDPITIDGGVAMPGRGLSADRFGRGVEDIEMEYGGGVTATVGYGSVATPGALAAYAAAHQHFGRAPWTEVLAPAIEVARQGFPLGSAASYYLSYTHASVFGRNPDSYAALHDGSGELLAEGALVRIPHLAETLELLAADGAVSFYTGAIADVIVADMAGHDGLVTAEDLTRYRPAFRPSLPVTVGGWQLGTNPPPAIGGAVLAAMLALMAGRPHGSWTAADVGHVIAVQDLVLRYRRDRLDPAVDRCAAAQELLALVAAGGWVGREAPSTLNVSVVDAEGNACVVTASDGYGSGVMVPGTGLWLNSALGEPELNPHGLHAMPPGSRLASNMAPTVGRGPDGAVFAVGSPGADRITTALLQVLAGFTCGGLSLERAIRWPRLHVRQTADGGLIEHEEDLMIPDSPLPTRSYPRLAMYFGGVGAALYEPARGLSAAGDPRRTAAVAIRSK